MLIGRFLSLIRERMRMVLGFGENEFSLLAGYNLFNIRIFLILLWITGYTLVLRYTLMLKNAGCLYHTFALKVRKAFSF